MKILGSKLILSKTPTGPKKETMVATVIEIGVLAKNPKEPKKLTYVVQYAQQMFNINKALRASPEEIKKLSKEQILARIKKHVLGNLGMPNLTRRKHSEHPSSASAKDTLKLLIRKFQAK